MKRGALNIFNGQNIWGKFIYQRKLPIRRSLRMKNGAQLCPGRGDHKNRGVNRRKNDIDNIVEKDT